MNHARLQRFYFETSAVNHLENKMNWEVALNTRAYQNFRGRGYFISPLVIFEILSTSDADRREQLIFFSQHLFEPTLLPSPEELIVSFVEAGCPKTEPEYDLISKGKIATHWRNICTDTRKTLLYDHGDILSRSKVLRELGKLLFQFHEHEDVKPAASDLIAGANLTVFQLVQHYGLGRQFNQEDSAARQHIGLVTLLVVFMFCGGLTLDRTPIELFWRRKGIRDFQNRIDYTFSNYPQLVDYGPFHLIAAMIDIHTDRTFSRGMIFDAFHAIYAVYSDSFLTADNHFRALRDWIPDDSPIKRKIHHLDDIEMHMAETSNAPDPKGWLDP